jgi:ElaB/YqjD/DUF883 family membrane-anchored ribosome-binding protein
METPVPTRAIILREFLLQYAAKACDRIARRAARIEEYATQEPARALGLALAAGMLLGWLVKRR